MFGVDEGPALERLLATLGSDLLQGSRRVTLAELQALVATDPTILGAGGGGSVGSRAPAVASRWGLQRQRHDDDADEVSPVTALGRDTVVCSENTSFSGDASVDDDASGASSHGQPSGLRQRHGTTDAIEEPRPHVYSTLGNDAVSDARMPQPAVYDCH